jgi:hypothetical protein
VMVKQETSELTLERVIRVHLEQVLEITHGNQSQAARILSLPLSTRRSKMKKLGVRVVARGGRVFQPSGKDSPAQYGNESTVGHFV